MRALPPSDIVLYGLSLVALAAQAMTAALAAGRRSMDWVGVCLLGSITALGGGTIRDVLLGHYPLLWVENPVYLGPLRGFLARVSMLTRGYRMREAELMGRLANQVFDGVQDAVMALLALGLDMEFYLAALALRERAKGAGLEMCLPEFIEPKAADEDGTEFEALFNPLLLLEPKPPRPCDLKLGASALVVITGPNSGGKTRLLEAGGTPGRRDGSPHGNPVSRKRPGWLMSPNRWLP